MPLGYLYSSFHIKAFEFVFYSVGVEFKGDYLNLRQNQKWKKINNLTHDVSLVFADLVHKVNRADGKVHEFVIFLFLVTLIQIIGLFLEDIFARKRRKKY